ncbi:MAG: WD40 repeat domain-containing protein [Chloroflexi bacterium]|nr:WD40 repeat domain-containing protein [Chloroflexota bacterium]MBP8057122.1 WD40 repeat domain-containing protein [Chloroflexota bacterium]
MANHTPFSEAKTQLRHFWLLIFLIFMSVALLILLSLYARTRQNLIALQATATETSSQFAIQIGTATPLAMPTTPFSPSSTPLITPAASPSIEATLAHLLTREANLTAEQINLQQQLALAQARELAAYAQANLALYPQRSLLLAIEALNSTGQSSNAPAAALEALYRSLAYSNGIGLHRHLAEITEITLSPDSRWLATRSRDNTIHLWDLTAVNAAATPFIFSALTLPFTTMAFSPDNRWLVTVNYDSVAAEGQETILRLWDLEKPDPTQTVIHLQNSRSLIKQLTFSPDGRWLVLSGSIIELWDMFTLSASATPLVLNGHQNWIQQLVISPDGHWLYASGEDGLLRWDLTASDISNSFTLLVNNADRYQKLALSQDGRWLAVSHYSNGTGIVQLWELTQEPPVMIPLTSALPGNPTHLLFSPDSQRLVANLSSNQKPLYLWDISGDMPSLTPYLWYEAEMGTVAHLAFSPDSHWLATSGYDHTVRLWDMQTVEEGRYVSYFSLYGHESPVVALAFTPDGQWLISASAEFGNAADNSVRLWPMSRQPHFPAVPFVLDGFDNDFRELIVTTDSRWLLTFDQYIQSGEGPGPGGDSTVRLYDLTTTPLAGEPFFDVFDKAYINAVALSSDNRWLAAASESQEAWLWDLTTPNPASNRLTLSGYASAVTEVLFTPDNRWLVTLNGADRAASDNGIRLYDLSTADPAAAPLIFTIPGDRLGQVTISDGGQWLAAWGENDRVYLWSLQTPDPSAPDLLFTVPNLGFTRNAVVISPDNRFLVAGSFWPDNSVYVFDLTTSDPTNAIHIIGGHENWVERIFFTPDSRWLLTAGYDWTGGIRLWDLTAENAAATIRVLSCGDDHFATISLSRRWVVTTDNNQQACLWDLAHPETTLQPIQLKGPENLTGAFTISPDDHWLAIGDRTNRRDIVHLWDLTAPEPHLAHIKLQGIDIGQFITFTPDGHWLITAPIWGNVRIWNLQVDELVEAACQTAGRNLTQSEWAQFMRDEPYRLTCPALPTNLETS